MVPVNVDKLQFFVDMGRLDPTATITMKQLVDSGMVTCSRVKFGIKLLGKVRMCVSSYLPGLVQ